jgi:hypothetical protein
MSSVKHAVELMKFSHGMLDTMLATVPADKGVHQVHPTSNHVVWTLGHLACTYAWFSGTIDAEGAAKLPESYNALFGMGSKPMGDAKAYPDAAEVRKAYDAAFAAYLKQVEGLSEAEAWTASAIDTGGFAKSKIDAAYKCAWHDGWHLGQVADLRRALGLPSIM